MRGPECGGVGRWCFERNLNQTLLFLHKTTVSTYPPLPRLYSPSLSSNHSTGFGRNGWAGLPLAAGGEIGLPPPMRAGNPGAKRRINFQLIVDEWSRKGKQLQVGHDANSSIMGAIMFTNYTELISAPFCTDPIDLLFCWEFVPIIEIK